MPSINSDDGMPGAKFPIGTRVTVRCECNPNYFLHGKVTRYDVGNVWFITSNASLPL